MVTTGVRKKINEQHQMLLPPTHIFLAWFQLQPYLSILSFTLIQ